MLARVCHPLADLCCTIAALLTVSMHLLLCEKMSATRITEDSFLLPEIKEKWYKDGDMHTMYVAEIIDILAR